MNYATKIAALRAQVGDLKKRIHVDFTGDGATTVFQMPTDTFPVLDEAGSYVVKLAGVTQTETTNYTLDKVTGTLTMLVAPSSNAALTIDCISVKLRDADWIQIINESILSLGNDYFKEFVDESLTTTAGALSIDLSTARPNCIAVYEFQHRVNSSENWVVMETYTNWRYDQDNNKIYVSNNTAFSSTGEALRIRGLETYTLGTLTTDIIDVQDRFMTVVDYGTIARYYQWRYKDVIELVSKFSTESTRTPLQELMMLADRYTRLYEDEKSKLKPRKPSRVIPRYLEGAGRP